VISRVDIGATPILTYAVSAQLGSRELRRLIEDRLLPQLQQLEGVAEVRITGGDVREIQVEVDLDRAKAAGVAPLEIAERLSAESSNVPAGHLSLGPAELSVRTLGQFSDPRQIARLPFATSRAGSQVRLGEVATVTDGQAERRTLARLNGKDAVLLEVVKQPGANTVAVAESARSTISRMTQALGNGFAATLLVDQSQLIHENAREVWVALLFGGAMAVLIIFVFLLDARGTFISSLALPTSVVGTLFVMYALGYTLNQMTLLALSLAIGLLIDDAVVVREAISRRLDAGEDPRSAASNGTRDVALAVLATTLTLVAVFVPVAFMPGIVGQFFKQFGITISAAVLISLFVSFTLDPMLSARLVKRRAPGVERRENAVARALQRAFEAGERGYQRLLATVLRNKVATLVATAAVLACSVLASRNLGSEFIAPEDRSQLVVDLQLPEQSTLELTARRAAEAEALLRRAIPELRDVYAIVGVGGDVYKAKLRALTVDKRSRKRSVGRIQEEVRRVLMALPATRVTVSDPPAIDVGGGDWYPIMARVTGPDLAQLEKEGSWLAGILRSLPGTADVRVDASPSKPELAVHIDRTRAADLGISAATLGRQLRLAIQGEVAAKLRDGQEETDVRVRLAARDRESPDGIRRMDLFTPTGIRQLQDVADVVLQDGPSVIEHDGRERQITVISNLVPGAALGDVAAQLKKAVVAHPFPPGYQVVWDGAMKTFDEQNEAFGAAFALALVFIFMVLASQFESLKHPFTIMVSLPLALVGALVGLLLTGNHLSLGAMIGVILLMGLVTKNAILLVDGALQRIREGDDVTAALLTAGPRRLRPILMTSVAMAIGMLPTAIGTGTGSEFRSPMAIAVIGGVIASTALTLLVVPVIFAGMEKLSLAHLFRRSGRFPSLVVAADPARGGSSPEPASPRAVRKASGVDRR
jgi:multidrug efflux pump subunit AcrB